MRHETRPIRYSNHAKERMLERNVSKAEVEEVVRTGALERQGLNEWLAFATINGRMVKVAYLETEDGEIEILLVKTVMT